MYRFLAMVMLLCVAACGGGGGGGGGKVATPPLSLSDVTPAMGATGVQRTAVVVLTFSAPLDATTLGASTITLAGPTGNQQIASSVAGNKLSVTPGGALSPSSPYTLTIGVGLRGSAGEQLAGPVTTSFTTVDRQWQTAAAIETASGNIAEDPHIAMNASGDAVAVWRRLDDQGIRIWSNHYSAGSGWGAALAIGPDTGPETLGRMRDPKAAVDASGNALAVWPQVDGGNFKIWANRSTAGTGWGTAASIEANASTDASDISAFPQIKFDANGNAIALWARSAGTHYHVWANRYTAGTGWNAAATLVDDNAHDADAAQIAFDANGDAIAVWSQSDDAGFHIWSRRYTVDTNSWGAAAQIIQNDDVAQAIGPQIGIDTAGNALVVWNQQTGIWANRYTAANGSWGTAARISDTAGGIGSPHMAMDTNGDALVVWSQVDDNTSVSVRWNRYTSGSGWGTAAQIEPGNGTYVSLEPQIACDPSGNALLVWDRANDVQSEIRSSRYTVSGGWAASVNAGSTHIILNPALAIDSGGNALAVWQQADNGSLWTNRFE